MKTSLSFSTAFIRRAAIALAGAALAACGGGGGDDASTAPPPVAARLVISSTNAPSVTAEAMQAISATGSATGGVAAQGDGSARSGSLGKIKNAAGKAAAQLKSIDRRSQATQSQTVACSGGGSFTITLNIAGAVVQGGDTLTITFNNCSELGTTSNGALAMQIVSVSGTGSALVLTTDATLTDFSVVDGPITERTNGTMRLTIDDSRADQTVITASSNNITSERRRGSELLSTRSITAWNMLSVSSDSSGLTSTTNNLVATGRFPVLGEGSFQVETLQPIVNNLTSPYPTAGRIRVSGANGSNLVATVQSTGLLVDVDADGNGTADSSRTFTWAELEALIAG